MDVAILAAARFPIQEPFAGGMEMHTHVLADELAARGHTVTVYAAAGEGRYRTEALLPVTFRPSPNARLDVSAGPDSALSEHHSYLDGMLRLADGGHELVHINAVHHLPFACTALLPCAVSATLHSPPTPWLESALELSAQRSNPASLVSVSGANAAQWDTVAIDRVIFNGVDLDTWQLGPGGDAAVWTGRLVPEKAPHLAIDAARLAGVALRLLGPIHDENYFVEQIQPRLGGDIEYLGHGSAAEVAAIVGRSSVAVVTPAWEEPFGLVVAEALACGTPVAGFARGALPELLDSSTGVLAAPGHVVELAAAITTAARLERADCRSRATERFSSIRMVSDYEDWFDELIAARL